MALMRYQCLSARVPPAQDPFQAPPNRVAVTVTFAPVFSVVLRGADVDALVRRLTAHAATLVVVAPRVGCGDTNVARMASSSAQPIAATDANDMSGWRRRVPSRMTGNLSLGSRGSRMGRACHHHPVGPLGTGPIVPCPRNPGGPRLAAG